MNVELRMRGGRVPPLPAAAWLLPDRSAAEWLAELVHWKVTLADAKLHVVCAPGSGDCFGALIIGAAPPPGTLGPRVLPYACMARRLFLPVDAHLDPPLTESELTELLDSDSATGDADIYIWHPQAGLLRTGGALAVADLIELPAIGQGDWDGAVPGIGLNDRLRSIEGELELTGDDAVDAGRDDIGAQPLDLNELPPSPLEPQPGAAAAVGRKFSQAIAQAVQWVTSQVPHTGQERNWINQVEDWANAKLHKLAESLEASRNRELARLVQLLQSNPDEGLRFALPLGDGGHRGQAAPGNRLTPRDVDYRHDQGGGQPGDPWAVPPSYEQQLRARYLELANRELVLGRHRRAAYIFAKLLGDLDRAAMVLADGRHWREAAVLYEQRLNRPTEAARCYRQAGDWPAAIRIYIQLKQYETVGDLYQQLAEPEEAAAAWRLAAEERMAAADFLSAARILEEKLQSPDQALNGLLQSWPRSSQAETCLGEAFALVARHGWHDRAQRLIHTLSDQTRQANLGWRTLVETLSRQAGEYPDPPLRRLATVQSRRLTSERLPQADRAEAGQLVQALTQLAPDDRLLRRDVFRYLNNRWQTKSLARPRMRAGRVPILTAAHQLPNLPGLPKVEWQTAKADMKGLYAAGSHGPNLVVGRMDWAGGSHEWVSLERYVAALPLLLVLDPFGVSPLIVHLLGREPISQPAGFFSAIDQMPRMEIGSHPGFHRNTVQALWTERETLHVIEYSADHSLSVHCFVSANVQLQGLVSLDVAELLTQSLPVFPLPALVREPAIVLGIDRWLCYAGRGQQVRTRQLPSPAVSMLGSTRHTRARMAVAMQQGALMLWGHRWDAAEAFFAQDLASPHLAFTRGGWLVAASDAMIEVYRMHGGRLELHAADRHAGGALIGAFALQRSDRFALVARDGRVLIYEVPD